MTVGARKQFCLHISNKADGDTTQRDREYRRKIFLIERDEFVNMLHLRTSLVVQWLCLPTPEAWVQSLIREIHPTCHH